MKNNNNNTRASKQSAIDRILAIITFLSIHYITMLDLVGGNNTDHPVYCCLSACLLYRCPLALGPSEFGGA
jgi:hypothetical protein